MTNDYPDDDDIAVDYAGIAVAGNDDLDEGWHHFYIFLLLILLLITMMMMILTSGLRCAQNVLKQLADLRTPELPRTARMSTF